MSDIVQKLWGFCHTLRHDGVDYGDYIEQLTYLLFLKMAEEKAALIPMGCDWDTLKKLSGTELTDHYSEVLRKLRESPGLLGAIFTQATSRFNNPVNLRRLIDMIDEEEWSSLNVDVKGAVYLGDTLYEPDRGERYDVVLTNPPFGTKGANQAPDRDDFTIETSNKQLNFVQHVVNTLKPGGRAAVVLPDNCLFEEKAGEVFEILMQDCNLHTVLRLPDRKRALLGKS